MLSTTPAASVVTWAPLTATTVPTASSRSVHSTLLATALLMVAGGAGMLSKNWFIILLPNHLKPKMPPNTRAVRTSIQNMRLFMGVSGANRSVDQEGEPGCSRRSISAKSRSLSTPTACLSCSSDSSSW
jgi:hypothetical protein